MDSVDENQPLLKNVRQGQQDLQYPDSHVKKAIEKEGGIGKLVFTVMLLGIFLSMACESLVAATHEEIASAFNALSLAPWLFTAYSVGYSMMLPLVRRDPPIQSVTLQMACQTNRSCSMGALLTCMDAKTPFFSHMELLEQGAS